MKSKSKTKWLTLPLLCMLCVLTLSYELPSVHSNSLTQQPQPLMRTYTNHTYGFLFQYPPAYSIEEYPHVVKLNRGTLMLVIAYREANETLAILGDTVAHVDLHTRGTVPFLGLHIARDVLLQGDRVRGVLYNHGAEIPAGHMSFVIRLIDLHTDRQTIGISAEDQAEIDAILASFALTQPEATPTVDQPAPTATPEQPTQTVQPTQTTGPGQDMEALRVELEQMVHNWDGENAVSVMDLQTGEMISVNGTRPQLAACTIKIGILMAVAEDLDQGRYTAAEIESLVLSAMGPSNTWPARELLRYAGGGDVGNGVRRVNQIMWDLGAKHSVLTHPPGYPGEEYGYAASHGVQNVLTTDDLVMILAKLYWREALSPAATDYMLWSMTLAPYWMNQSFAEPLPQGVWLHHKVGQLYGPWNTWNDAGIVTFFTPDGQHHAYAIAYLGSYGPSWQSAYSNAKAVSSSAWHYFSVQYGYR